MDPQVWHKIAAVSGVAALGLGTYGAHVFKPQNPSYREVWHTASLYHLVHTTALVAAPMAKNPNIFGGLLTAGILGFSGSCYTTAYLEDRKYAKLAPFGGFAFMAAWSEEEQSQMPTIFNKFIGKQFLFKIKVKKFTSNVMPSFTISKMSTDDEIINQFIPNNGATESTQADVRELKDKAICLEDDDFQTPKISKSCFRDAYKKTVPFPDLTISPDDSSKSSGKRSSDSDYKSASEVGDDYAASVKLIKKIKQEKI